MEENKVVETYEVNEDGTCVPVETESDGSRAGTIVPLVMIGAGAVTAGVIIGKKLKAKLSEKIKLHKAIKSGAWIRMDSDGTYHIVEDPSDEVTEKEPEEETE